MIKARKSPNWYPLLYMVIEEEFDQVITSWLKSWKFGLGSTRCIVPSTSEKEIAPKEMNLKGISLAPQDTMPKYTTEKNTDTGRKDKEVEVYEDLDTDGDAETNRD